MKLRDKYGWPILKVKGRPFKTLFRRIQRFSLTMTWRMRRRGNIMCPECGEYMMKKEHKHTCRKATKSNADMRTDGKVE